MKPEIHNQSKLKPHKITRPIQLLAAWLVGLVLVDSLFLTSAIVIDDPPWIRPMLTISAVAFVPMFLGAIFLLQTKFRPEMQEDHYFYKYWESKTGNSPIEPIPAALVTWTSARKSRTASEDEPIRTRRSDLEVTPRYKWGQSKVAVNKYRSDFLQLLAVLKQNSIPFSDTFGSEEKVAPPYLQIAAGHKVGVTEVKLIVLAFAHYKEGRITLIAPHEEPNELSDTILIGSYGMPSGPRLVEAYEILDKDLMSDGEFLNFIREGKDSY